jgi:hypothetical protein
LSELNHTSEGAPNVSLVGMSLSGAFSQGATDSLTRMAKIKFPTPIYSGSLSYLPARQRWIDWHMLESIGAPKAPTALHSDYAPERPGRRSRMWAAGNRGSGSSELGIPPEISIYSDSGWDSSEPNVRLEEYNYNEGQLSSNPLTFIHQLLTLVVNSETSYLIWN